MIKLTPHEELQQEIRSRKEEIDMYERIYKKGAGCFGVGRKAPAIKKKLTELRAVK
jgi:hypothetical protein